MPTKDFTSNFRVYDTGEKMELQFWSKVDKEWLTEVYYTKTGDWEIGKAKVSEDLIHRMQRLHDLGYRFVGVTYKK